MMENIRNDGVRATAQAESSEATMNDNFSMNR